MVLPSTFAVHRILSSLIVDPCFAASLPLPSRRAFLAAFHPLSPSVGEGAALASASARTTSVGRKPSKRLVVSSMLTVCSGRPGTSCVASVRGAVRRVKFGNIGVAGDSLSFVDAKRGGRGGTGGISLRGEGIGVEAKEEELDPCRDSEWTFGRQNTSGRLSSRMPGWSSRKRTRTAPNVVVSVVRPESVSVVRAVSVGGGGTGDEGDIGEALGDRFMGCSTGINDCSTDECGCNRFRVSRFGTRERTRGRTYSSGEEVIDTVGALLGILRFGVREEGDEAVGTCAHTQRKLFTKHAMSGLPAIVCKTRRLRFSSSCRSSESIDAYNATRAEFRNSRLATAREDRVYCEQ